jgi:hypothetical protein
MRLFLLLTCSLIVACDGGAGGLCNAQNCPVGEVCAVSGSCEPVVCTRHACADSHTLAICIRRQSVERRACGDGELCFGGRCEIAACIPGEFRCAPSGMRERCLDNGQGFAAQGCAPNTFCHVGACLPASCTSADDRCIDTTAIRRCNENGTAMVRTDCSSAQRCSKRACRPIICEPGEPGCASAVHAGSCNPTGTGWDIEQVCDQGVRATCNHGACVPECRRQALGIASYIGCSYRPVELPNLRGSGHDEHPFAVTVANSSEVLAKVSVFEPGDIFVFTQTGWVEPRLCDAEDCDAENSLRLDALLGRDLFHRALAFLPEALSSSTASGGLYGAACPEGGRCQLRVEAPGAALGTLSVSARGRCELGQQSWSGPCFVSDEPVDLALAWGDQRVALDAARVGGRLNDARTRISDGRIIGFLATSTARHILVPGDPGQPRRALYDLLDPAQLQEATSERTSGWSVQIEFGADRRAGEVPARVIGTRVLSDWVPALGGAVSARVASEVIDASGDVIADVRGAAQFVAIPEGATGIFLLRSDRRATRGVESAGYRLGASVPVSAFQFNPLCCNFNYSNDASLLLPESAAANDYVVVVEPQWFNRSGFVSVVAVQDGTQVQVTLPESLRGRANAVRFGDGVQAGADGVASQSLGAYEVWTITTGEDQPTPDLTGMRVRSSFGDVLVFVGHEALQVPISTSAPDHLEEMMPPLASWGSSFIVPRPIFRNPEAAEERTYYRLIAGPNGSQILLDGAGGEALGITHNPAIPSCRDHLNPQGFIELGSLENCAFSLRESFRLTGDQPFAVAQIFVGQDAVDLPRGAPAGDPSLTILPPIDQLRADYLFIVPPTYALDYVTIAAPANTELLLDGRPIDLLGMANPDLEPFLIEPATPIGNTGWMRYTVRVGDGAHRLESVDPGIRFAANVYAFDAFVSYAYPGGLNLAKSLE